METFTTSTRLLLASVACLIAMAGPLVAQDEVPSYLAYPRNTLLYGEIDTTGDLSKLLNLKNYEEAGALGLESSVMSQLRTLLLPEASDKEGIPELRTMMSGVTRICAGWLDVAMSEKQKIMVVFEHNDVSAMMKVLQDAHAQKALVLEQEEEFDGHIIYRLQVPEKWFDGFLFSRRRWSSYTVKTEDALTEPIYLTTWGGDRMIVCTHLAEIKDGLETLDFPEDTEESIAGRRSFRTRAVPVRKTSDAFLYWNINVVVTWFERIGGGFGGAAESIREFISIAELKQLEALVTTFNYNLDAGTMASNVSLSFTRPPSWMEILNVPQGSVPLASFAPADTFNFTTFSVGNLGDLYKRVIAYVTEKANATGNPDLIRSIDTGSNSLKERLGFGVAELLQLMDGNAAIITPSPEAPRGEEQAGWAIAIGLSDAEAVRKLLDEKIQALEEEKAREYFFHSADAEYLNFDDGSSVRIRSFNLMDHDSWAYTIVDSTLLIGTRDGLKRSITAHKSKQSLDQDPRYQNYLTTLPEKMAISSWFNADVVERAANEVVDDSVTDTAEALAMARAPLVDPVKSGVTEVWSPSIANRHRERSLSRILLRPLCGGFCLSVDAESVSGRIVASGTPTMASMTEAMVISQRTSNLVEAATKLGSVSSDRVFDYLYATGDLPTDLASFANAEEGLADFRDPSLATEQHENLTEAECFEWLGSHATRSLTSRLPLLASKVTNHDGRILVLFSDESLRLISRENLDKAISGDLALDDEGLPMSLEDLAQRVAELPASNNSDPRRR